MPSGSTPIDFAYAIHSAVGNKMIGARVNGNIVKFDHVLVTSDRVEIITSQNSTGPKIEWLNMVKSAHARNKINQWFKHQNKEENIVKGKGILENESKRRGCEFSELFTEERKNLILRRYNFNTADQLFASVGHGGIKEGHILKRLIDEFNKEAERQRRIELQNAAISDESLAEALVIDNSEKTKVKNQRSGIVITGVGDVFVRFSKCCSPVPGDDVVGFVTRGRGVSVHRTDCVNVINFPQDERARLTEVSWDAPANNPTYRADLNIICEDRLGLIIDISKVFSDNRVPVKHLSARTHANKAVFEVSVEIGSRENLDRVCQKVLSVEGVSDIRRMTN
jgi:GTP pyrophosphokinase